MTRGILPFFIIRNRQIKTHTEIAENMNLSVKSINRYKQKTMELLRNALKDYLPLLLLLLLRA